MKNYHIVFAACLLLLPALAVAADEQDSKSMLGQLKVGDRIAIYKAMSGGHDLRLIDDDDVARTRKTQPTYEPTKIIEVERDYIVVQLTLRYKQVIAAQSIHTITIPTPEPKD